MSALAPGMTRDEYALEFGTGRDEAERLKLQRGGIPLERLAEPEEVAEAVLFLASQPFCNGTILQMSGGNVRAAFS